MMESIDIDVIYNSRHRFQKTDFVVTTDNNELSVHIIIS